jgi:hypothetical protein
MRQQAAATLTIGVASGSLLHAVETKEMSVFHEACVLFQVKRYLQMNLTLFG